MHQELPPKFGATLSRHLDDIFFQQSIGTIRKFDIDPAMSWGVGSDHVPGTKVVIQTGSNCWSKLLENMEDVPFESVEIDGEGNCWPILDAPFCLWISIIDKPYR